jgi:uncharacterized protein HemY
MLARTAIAHLVRLDRHSSARLIILVHLVACRESILIVSFIDRLSQSARPTRIRYAQINRAYNYDIDNERPIKAMRET